jgi:ribonuclease Z
VVAALAIGAIVGQCDRAQAPGSTPALRTGFLAVGPATLHRAFITHMHSDHTLGTPELILTTWTLGAKVRPPLELYGPPGLRATAFVVHHGTLPHAFGYRIRTPDKLIVLSGDAGPPSTVAEQCRGCDILVHEGGTMLASQFPSY